MGGWTAQILRARRSQAVDVLLNSTSGVAHVPNIPVSAPTPQDIKAAAVEALDPSPSLTGTFSISQEPMKVNMGGIQTAADAVAAGAAGWLGGYTGLIDQLSDVQGFLAECASQGRRCFLNITDGMATNTNIDALLADTNFSVIDGIETEGGSWTEDKFRRLHDGLSSAGHLDKLYSYLTMWSGGGDPDPTLNVNGEATITNITVASGVVTVTCPGHGKSNSDRVGIYDVRGMTQINYKTYLIDNVTTDSFTLNGIDGSSWNAYTSGGRCAIGTQPTARSWKKRSRLWYPWFMDEPIFSYDPTTTSSTRVAKLITGATQANPVVITSTAHGFSNGDTVSIKDPVSTDEAIYPAPLVGMDELKDRQFTVANVTANTLELQGEDGTGHTAYTSGGALKQGKLGRTKQISARFDPSMEAMRTLAGFVDGDLANRRLHCWLQAFGQPMSLNDWDDSQNSAVQPGKGHIHMQLWMAHLAKCEIVSFYTYRAGVYDNRHAGTSQSGVNRLNDMSLAGSLTSDEQGQYERLWTRLLEAYDLYMAGPTNFPNNSDGSFNYETPYVGVVPGGQSTTRLNSSTA